MLNRLRERLRTVAAGLPALQRVGSAEHIRAAAAVEGGAVVHQTFLQRHGQRDDLECGAGLIRIGQRLVAPLKLLRRAEQLRRFLVAFRCVDLRLCLLADSLIVVQVKVAERGHAQNCAGVGVHGDRRRAVLHVVVLHGLLQVLFHVILDRRVERERHVLAVGGVVIILVIDEEHIRAVAVRGAHHASLAAGQRVVIAVFNAGQAAVVRSDKADDVRGQTAVRIIALGVRLDLDADDVVLFLERAHLIRDVALHLARDDLIP